LNRKLLLLDLVLLGAVVYAGSEWRSQYQMKLAREAAMLQKKTPPAPPPPLSPLARVQAVMASGFANIAEKMLFDRSRNSIVVKEVPPPPPVKPVPPFPVLKGMMNLGDGLTAVFAEKSGGTPREVKPGQQIGQFKLIAVNEKEAVFGWDGKEFHKAVLDIMDRTLTENAETSRPAAPPPGAGVPPPAVVKIPTGPGAQTTESTRACNTNDSTAAGAVVDGYKKVSVQTVFGAACRWEKVP
jgi:hypothetical protein